MIAMWNWPKMNRNKIQTIYYSLISDLMCVIQQSQALEFSYYHRRVPVQETNSLFHFGGSEIDIKLRNAVLLVSVQNECRFPTESDSAKHSSFLWLYFLISQANTLQIDAYWWQRHWLQPCLPSKIDMFNRGWQMKVYNQPSHSAFHCAPAIPSLYKCIVV